MNTNSSKKRIILICTLLLLLISTFANIPLAKAQDSDVNLSKKPIEVIVSRQEDLEPLKLNLSTTLKTALKNNLNIAISQDKVDENKLKLEEIKNQKLFLFFKFANVNALIDSAKYSLKAAEANQKSTINTVIYDATNKYYTLLQALLAKKVAEEFLKKGELSLKEENELLNSGEVTKFDVKQSEVFVESLKQKLLDADIAYMMSSVDLAQYINEKDFNVKIIPEEFNIINGSNGAEIPIQKLNLIPDNILLNNCIKTSLNYRPEIEEINFQIKSLNEMKNATKFDEIKVQTINSQIKQLENTLKMTQNGIKATVTQALLKLIGAKNQIEVAKQKYILSQSALEQAKVSRKEGLATNKDIIDAQINFANSKNDYINAINQYNKAQVYLLKELGTIDIDTINSNKTVSLPENSSQENNNPELKQEEAVIKDNK